MAIREKSEDDTFFRRDLKKGKELEEKEEVDGRLEELSR
jgi:hypothetical protein